MSLTFRRELFACPLRPLQQGRLGDCWLVAMLNSLILRQPFYLFEMVKEVGLRYEVRLAGESYIVDATFPSNGQDGLLGVSDESGLFAPLIEKACTLAVFKRKPLWAVERRSKRGVDYSSPSYIDLDGMPLDFAVGLLLPGCMRIYTKELACCTPFELIFIIKNMGDGRHHINAVVPSVLVTSRQILSMEDVVWCVCPCSLVTKETFNIPPHAVLSRGDSFSFTSELANGA